MNKKLHIAIRSYKRAGKIKTLDLFKNAIIWVPESQKKEYSKYYDNLKTIPDKEDGSSSKKLNSILNRCKSDWILILDDDITDICYWEDGKERKVDSKDIEDVVEHYFVLAEELGVKLWGLNQNSDPVSYKTYNPFSMLSPILAPFSGHIKPKLRYDEDLIFKGDYDFWLQNIHRHRKTLRVNKYCYKHYHGTGLGGGLVGIRTMDKELESLRKLKEKWGSKIVKGTGGVGAGKTGTNVLNTNIYIPIKGI